MSELNNSYSYSFIYSFVFLLYLINVVKNTNLTHIQLNNIIRLGQNNFAYNHISINSKGDLIIDLSSSTDGNRIRRIYALYSNGSPYFGKTPFKTIETNLTRRKQGECFMVKYINEDKEDECLIFIPMKNDSLIESYFLDNEDNETFKKSKNNFNEITSSKFSLIKSQFNREDNNIEYIFSYISDEKFTISKGYFNMFNDPYFIKEQSFQIGESKNMMVSCYLTENGIYICFYFDTKEKAYIAIAFTYNNNYNNESFEFNKDDADHNNKFSKAIYLKEEIGAFIYFYNLSDSEIENYPVILFKQYKDSNLINYNNLEFYIDKYKFSNDEKFNDFIKLNDDQVCYISSDNSTKEYLYIVIITLFDSDTKISERYYKQNMANYNIKFYNQIVSNLYNDFITILFSHYLLINTTNKIQASFIILGYPVSNKYIIDIIEEIKEKNKPVDQLCFSLDKTLNITNNIYGYIFIGTKIINFSDNIDIYLEGEKITKNKIINKDKCVTISFPKNDGIYKAGTYNIELAYVVTEPEYDSIKDYAEINFENEERNNYGESKGKLDYIRHNFTGNYSNFSFIINSDFLCKDNNCITCDNSPICLICKEDFNINQYGYKCKYQATQEPENPTDKTTELQSELNTEEKKDILVSQTVYIPQIIITEINESIYTNTNIIEENNIETISIIFNNITVKNKNNCSYDDILINKCQYSITSDQTEYIDRILKEKLKTNQSLIITTEKVIFQISTSEEQKSNNNENISSIDLGDECEQRIKVQEDLSENDNLIIYKIDIKSEDLSMTYVQYEVYNPKNFSKINLSICEDLLINLNIPILLNGNTESLLQSLSDSGYDLFNLNDSFYNDICTTYTTKDGTDLTLSDRKNIIYDKNSNISMCQKGCNLINYNSTIKKSNCNCNIQTENIETNIENINFDEKEMLSSFYKALTMSNFRILKCYKLVFSKKGQINNIGSIFLSIMTFIFIILLIIYIITGQKKLNQYIQLILKYKLYQGKNLEKPEQNINIIKNQIKSMKAENKVTTKTYKNKFKSNNNNFPPKKYRNNNNILNSLSSTNKNITISPKIEQFNVVINNKINKYKKSKKKSKENKYNSKLNDEELNNLDYESAILLDKRTYFQYYLSLIKKKQLLLFTFLPAEDYNLIIIKILLLILSFSLYLTVNTFFFSDETMNKINQEKGAFDLFYQLPQIIYSTLICAAINLILKNLSLTEKQILIIKQEKTYKNAEKKSKKIKTCLRIKLAIFFLIGFLLMTFFWYFVSCFCAVYKNTQKHLIKDTLLSFGLSMLYPFGLNFLPGIFRIPALRAKNGNMKYLYQLSLYVALI